MAIQPPPRKIAPELAQLLDHLSEQEREIASAKRRVMEFIWKTYALAPRDRVLPNGDVFTPDPEMPA